MGNRVRFCLERSIVCKQSSIISTYVRAAVVDSLREDGLGMVDVFLKGEAANLADSALTQDALRNTKAEKKKRRRKSMKMREEIAKSLFVCSSTNTTRFLKE